MTDPSGFSVPTWLVLLFIAAAFVLVTKVIPALWKERAAARKSERKLNELRVAREIAELKSTPRTGWKKEAEGLYFRKMDSLEQLRQLDPLAFERYVARLFENMGYEAQTTRRIGDQGVDLVLRKEGRVSIAQCKRYDGSVGASVMRDLYGAMVHNRAREAFLVTTGTITMPARQWAANKPIHMIDGITLVEWAKEQKKQAHEQRISPAQVIEGSSHPLSGGD